MGRRKTIDRDAILDAAEDIVSRRGASALTIDAVAKAVGITKGGVQYSFASKDALIDAMFQRWDQGYEAAFREIAGDAPDPVTAVRAHVEAARRASDDANAKAASLLAALLQTPEDLGSVRAWYAGRLAGLDASSEEGRRARLAFLATEGAFLLRYFGLMEIGPEEWRAIFADIGSLAAPAVSDPPA
jgi:AcrR family transcriptional regulator